MCKCHIDQLRTLGFMSFTDARSICVLFCALGGHGFVYPQIRMAKALAARGHRVAFVTSEHFRDVLNANGFRRIPRGADDGASFEIKSWHQTLSVAMQAQHVRYALTEFDPDVIVTSHLAFGPMIEAERRDIPVCVLGGGCYLFPPITAAVDLPTDSLRNLQWNYDDLLKRYNNIRDELGLKPRWSSEKTPALNGDALLVRSTPEIVSCVGTLPKGIHLIGDCLWEPAELDDVLLNWMEEQSTRSLAYVQLGRTFDRPSNWPTVREALAGRDMGAVVSTARMESPLPADIESQFFLRPHIMQGAAIERSDLIITTGHPTAVLGALAHGKPLIMLPSGSGTYEMAWICTRLGVAVAIDAKEATKEMLDCAVARACFADEMAARSQDIAHALRAIDGGIAAVSVIEGLVGSGASAVAG